MLTVRAKGEANGGRGQKDGTPLRLKEHAAEEIESRKRCTVKVVAGGVSDCSDEDIIRACGRRVLAERMPSFTTRNSCSSESGGGALPGGHAQMRCSDCGSGAQSSSHLARSTPASSSGLQHSKEAKQKKLLLKKQLVASSKSLNDAAKQQHGAGQKGKALAHSSDGVRVEGRRKSSYRAATLFPVVAVISGTVSLAVLILSLRLPSARFCFFAVIDYFSVHH